MEKLTEDELRQNLSLCYRILANLQLDDMTYTHLSARLPHSEAFFIYPFGLLFSEVTPQCLLKIKLDGTVLEGIAHTYNPTGYVIHSSIYRHRPDINAIFHLHTEAGVAVSAMQCGLLPISQWALHFYERLSYHDYHALALTAEHESKLVHDLKDNFTLFLKNHGTLTAGRTLHEALFYTHHLEKACRTQCLALASQTPLTIPPPAVCLQTVNELLNFEADLGKRDWDAHVRRMNQSSKTIV